MKCYHESYNTCQSICTSDTLNRSTLTLCLLITTNIWSQIKKTNISDIHTLEVVAQGSETQP